MYRLNHLARAAALGILATLAACESKRTLLGPSTPPGGDIFASYVSIGNSITAGYQSGGINDSTQRRSYAVLLGAQMGTRFAYPSINLPGCPVPVANFVTGAFVGGVPSGAICALRSPASVTDVLNNVAVPFAAAADPTALSPTTVATPLPQLILGGKTQVQRALEAHPTFVTVWIGNNDVLLPVVTGTLGATAGVTPGLTTVADFQTRYKAMIDQLIAGAPGLRGLLIGVLNATVSPAFVPAAALASPAVQAAINAATGKTVVIDPACATSTWLVVLRIAEAIKSGQHPPFISCTKNVPRAPIGDAFMLDNAELATINTTVAGYNALIKGQADANGFAYYDPNVLMAAKRATGEIPLLPNFASPLAPFGTLFSLDGVHPSSAAHVLLANEFITTINAKYGTSLKPAQ